MESLLRFDCSVREIEKEMLGPEVWPSEDYWSLAPRCMAARVNAIGNASTFGFSPV